jgi:hypothetical protein
VTSRRGKKGESEENLLGKEFHARAREGRGQQALPVIVFSIFRLQRLPDRRGALVAEFCSYGARLRPYCNHSALTHRFLVLPAHVAFRGVVWIRRVVFGRT